MKQMTYEEIRSIVNSMVEIGDFPLLEAGIEAALEITPNMPTSMPWQFAFEHAIDTGSLLLVQEIDRRFYYEFGSGNKDMWSIYRSSHKNHFDLVQYFVEEKKKERICFPYIFDEIARAGAANNNKGMVAYAFREICDLYEDATDEQQKNAIFEILADRSGPIKVAATHGHVEMLQYLVSALELTLSSDQKNHLTEVLKTISPLYYGRNVALRENNHNVVDYIDSLLQSSPKQETAKKESPHRFFSKSTGMEVGGAHLTDAAMADFYLQMKAR